MNAKKYFILILVLIPSLSFAYLGEHTSRLAKSMRATKYKQVQINENVDEDGVIRKISWNGLHHPELKNLLGPCYTHYQDFMQQKSRTRLRGAVSIEKDGCHITIGGHMGNVSGEAKLDK